MDGLLFPCTGLPVGFVPQLGRMLGQGTSGLLDSEKDELLSG